MSPNKHRRTFISYSRINKEFALNLALELRSSGFDIWLDQLDIPTGSRWDDEVEQALESCEIFMVILTPASSTSSNVKDEIGYAIDTGKRILPILLENAKVPLRLIRFQYVDFTKKSYEEGVESAKQLLRRLIDEPTIPRDQSLDMTQVPIVGGDRIGNETTEPIQLPAQKTKEQQSASEGTKQVVGLKVEKENQEAEGFQKTESQPPKLLPVPQKQEWQAAIPGKRSRMPLVLGAAGVGFVAVVAFAIFAISNGFGREIPNTGAPDNSLAAEEIAASPVPILVEVEITNTPAPTQTQEEAQPTTTLAPTVVPDTPTLEDQKYFTEEFEADLQSWSTYIADAKNEQDKPVIKDEEFSDVNVSVRDGMYFFDIGRRLTYVYSTYDSFGYEDVRVDARVDSRKNNVNNVRLICRYSAESGWYEFRITNNGPYGIYFAKPNATGLISYRTLADGNSTNTNPGNAVNEYSIICQGDDTLSLYINGELARTTSDLFKELRTGKVGVSVSSLNNLPVLVGFDWVKISEPE
jgi:hypothetical protein